MQFAADRYRYTAYLNDIKMPDTLNEIALGFLKALENAWNTADGQAYGQLFTEDADFVDIRGEHHHGRAVIGHGHQAIFDTIYRDSEVHYELLQVRRLSQELALVHMKGTLTAPSGPLAGVHSALASFILVEGPERWQIAALHNTLIQGS